MRIPIQGSPLILSILRPNLYVSDCVYQEDLPALQAIGIGAIVNLVEDHTYLLPDSIAYLHTAVFSDGIVVSSNKLHQIYTFIDQYIPSRKVLVHCAQGISRSAAIVIGEICRLEPAWSWEDALAFVRQEHPLTEPHPNVVRGIRTYLKR